MEVEDIYLKAGPTVAVNSWVVLCRGWNGAASNMYPQTGCPEFLWVYSIYVGKLLIEIHGKMLHYGFSILSLTCHLIIEQRVAETE
jgi:hypothetical protein